MIKSHCRLSSLRSQGHPVQDAPQAPADRSDMYHIRHFKPFNLRNLERSTLKFNICSHSPDFPLSARTTLHDRILDASRALYSRIFLRRGLQSKKSTVTTSGLYCENRPQYENSSPMLFSLLVVLCKLVDCRFTAFPSSLLTTWSLPQAKFFLCNAQKDGTNTRKRSTETLQSNQWSADQQRAATARCYTTRRHIFLLTFLHS
jgi:hypothetical protein